MSVEPGYIAGGSGAQIAWVFAALVLAYLAWRIGRG